MGKAQFPSTFNFQTTNPEIGFLPSPGPNQNAAGNSPKSGVLAGVMASTNIIYSNILGIRQTDNQGLELNWTGTPTGTIQVMVSNSGIQGNFYALTFNPLLAQPSGAAGGYVISLTAIPFQYMYIVYTNTSGSGTITAYSQCKSNNS